MDKLTEDLEDCQLQDDSGVEDGSVATASVEDEQMQEAETRKKLQEAEKTRKKLQDLYAELKGTEFTGTYCGHMKLPIANSMGMKYIIEVSSESEYGQKLKEIIKKDPKDYVWKGLTGPPEYTNYWLWAEEIENDEADDLELLESRRFKQKKTYVRFESTQLFPGGLIKLYFTTVKNT